MICVNTCAVIEYGSLYMVGGSPAQAKALYPALPGMAARKIKQAYPDFKGSGYGEDYGFLEVIPPPHGIGIFQIRQHWSQPVNLKVVETSVRMLSEFALSHPDVHIRLPFPSVEKAHWEGVQAILSDLPDNVSVAIS